MTYIRTQNKNGMKILESLLLKNVLSESLLLMSNAPLSITNTGIEKSLKQSKNAEIKKADVLIPVITKSTEEWQNTIPIMANALNTS